MFRFTRVRPYERGLIFRNDVFAGVLPPGDHRRFDPLGRERIDVVNLRKAFMAAEHVELLAATPALAEHATLVDIGDAERALVWIDGRFEFLLGPGRYGFWNGLRNVRIERADARTLRFQHVDFDAIVGNVTASGLLDVHDVPAEHAGVLFVNGQYVETLGPGRYAFWRHRAPVKLIAVNRKEQQLDVPGQDIVTADRVTIRLTVVGTYRAIDPVRTVTATDDAKVALYRDVQLAVRAAVGTRTLDAVLADKATLVAELTETVKAQAAGYGLAVAAVGVKDVVLPGEMKELLNKVIEARTAAEAAVITRREETAALRHQANAAKVLTDTPGLMKLRELEAVERIAAGGKLTVVLGDVGLAEQLRKMV